MHFNTRLIHYNRKLNYYHPMFSNDSFINIHTHQPQKNSEIVEIVNDNCQSNLEEGTYYSFGVHPWHIGDYPLSTVLPLLMERAALDKTMAIGEAGIDRVINTPYETQEQYFKAQITVSEYYKKPMIIHCVKAYSDILALRKVGNYKMPWIIHSFNANKQTADQLIKMNFYLSFGKSLLDPESKAAQVFPMLPIKSLFLETDDSDINIADLYSHAASLRKLTVAQLKQKIAENARTCFKR